MTVTTKENGTMNLVKVYDRGEKFFGKVLVRFDGDRTSTRITLEQWEEIITSDNRQKK
jgi:hypothetical protein